MLRQDFARPSRLGASPKFMNSPVKVIASSFAKAIACRRQALCRLNAENFHPGKGTTTSIGMRRIATASKPRRATRPPSGRARACGSEQFLYQDGEGFHFMNTENYDQVNLNAEMVGDLKAYLQPEMKVDLALHEGIPISLEIPQKVTLEIVETEPTQKGQTASGSFKTALLSNGVKTMVPGHIGVGTRVIVMTEDGSYVERAKE